MASSSATSIVCQIPDCATTQDEIEQELNTFLKGFCSVCNKERNGKLCGCAFPCSLTFRSHMLNKIHSFLGITCPPDRKAIQVSSPRSCRSIFDRTRSDFYLCLLRITFLLVFTITFSWLVLQRKNDLND